MEHDAVYQLAICFSALLIGGYSGLYIKDKTDL